MSQIGTYEPPLSQTTGLNMPLADIQGLVSLLEDGGFMVHPMGEPWGDETVSWQAFYCGQGNGIVAVSIAMLLDRSELPHLTVHPCRSIFWRLLWPSDAGLAKRLVAWLVEHGAMKG